MGFSYLRKPTVFELYNFVILLFYSVPESFQPPCIAPLYCPKVSGLRYTETEQGRGTIDSKNSYPIIC